MDVTDFLHKLAIVPDIEIVISLLPEMLGLADQAARHALLQRLESIGEHAALGFADQQVNMLRHDYIPVHAKSETAPHTLEGEFEDSLGGVGHEQRSPMITGECDEVAAPGFLKSLQSPRHEARLRPGKVPTQAKTRLEWGTVRE